MSLAQFYGGLAIAASVFVGILTAYLVTRLSDLKSERSRIRQRIESIDAELNSLKSQHELRTGKLQETEDKWKLEEAEDDVDEFIKKDVGDNWNPSPEDITIEDALDALAVHRELVTLIVHHEEMIKERWDEIVEELKPRRPADAFGINVSEVTSVNETYDAANWIIDTLWDIYDREKYDTHHFEVLDIDKRIDELLEERERLVEKHDSLNPERLRDSIKSSIVPIVMSVIIPLAARFSREISFLPNNSRSVTVIEAAGVSIIWLIGFFWTLRFVWKRIADEESEIPETPLDEDYTVDRNRI